MMFRLSLLLFLLAPTLALGQFDRLNKSERIKRSERREKIDEVFNQFEEIVSDYESLLKTANDSIRVLNNEDGLSAQIETLKKNNKFLVDSLDKFQTIYKELESKVDDVRQENSNISDDNKNLAKQLTDTYTLLLSNWETSFEALGEYDEKYPSIIAQLLKKSDLTFSQKDKLEQVVSELDVLILIKEAFAKHELYFEKNKSITDSYIKELDQIKSPQLQQIKLIMLSLLDNENLPKIRNEFSKFIDFELKNKPTINEGKIDSAFVAMLNSTKVMDISDMLLESQNDIYYLTWLFDTYDKSIEEHKNFLKNH